MYLYTVLELSTGELYTECFKVVDQSGDAINYAFQQFMNCENCIEVLLTSQKDALETPINPAQIIKREIKKERLAKHFQ